MVPEPIGVVCERALKRAGTWSLIGGRILPRVPAGASPLAKELLPPDAADAVLARVDLEETSPYARPILERLDLGRDFYVGDESGRALVRVGDGGRLHPDVELHLDTPFQEHREEDEDGAQATYVRVLRTGDPVYVLGRAGVRPGNNGEADAGYRDAPYSLEFSHTSVIHLYDAPAFEQLAAWHSLPWYRKLSVLVRNR